MSQYHAVPENKNDDLDLINLFERVFSFFRNYAWVLVICSLLGLLAGFTLYKIAPKQYASTLLLHSFTLTNTEHINVIENWNTLLKNDEYEVLAERLHCDPAMLKKVSRIKATEIQKLYIPNNPNGFVVEAWVKDNSILDSLGNGIVYGLENGDYLKVKLAGRKANLTQLIEKVKSEIVKMDSTKKNIEYNINSNNRSPSAFMIDISTINAQVIGLNEKLLAYQEELKFTNAVQVLHKFEKFGKPVSPKLFKSIVLGLVGGFAIGYLLSLYLYMRKRIARRSSLQ